MRVAVVFAAAGGSPFPGPSPHFNDLDTGPGLRRTVLAGLLPPGSSGEAVLGPVRKIGAVMRSTEAWEHVGPTPATH